MKQTLIIGIVSGCVGAILALALYSYFYDHQAIANIQDLKSTADILIQEDLPKPAFQQSTGPAGNPVNQYSNEELINISVYESANRGVVNIRTEISVQRGLFVRRGEGAGSGWVLDKEGHIVTNYHVIESSEKIEVTLFEGTTITAELIGADPANDVALLRIVADPDILFPIEAGDSDILRVGQKAIAIGNPFGFERSMTSGIISSVNRALEASDGRLIKSIIQVDAALNQGNSGGPLLDSSGRLIGMNTAIKSAANDQSAQNSGVGFAIPVNTIRRVVPQLKEHGRVVRPTIGVVQAVPTRNGLALIELIPNGPAERAGIKAVLRRVQYRYGSQVVQVQEKRWDDADIVLAVDGTAVRTFDEMLTAVEHKNPGDKVLLRILRGGKISEVEVTTTDDQ